MLQHLLNVYSRTVMDLIPIINPIAVSLFFLTFISTENSRSLNRASLFLGCNIALVLIIVLLIGEAILRFFGLTVDYVRVVGGILVFVVGWRMLNTEPTSVQALDQKKSLSERIFYPITMPFAVGGGALAVILSIATFISTNAFKINFLENIAAILGIITTAILVALCCRFAHFFKKILGEGGIAIFMFIFAILILLIGVSIFWTGASSLLIALFK
ncbi:MAG: MarC family protein [Gammaproteobacteria bacterium]